MPDLGIRAIVKAFRNSILGRGSAQDSRQRQNRVARISFGQINRSLYHSSYHLALFRSTSPEMEMAGLSRVVDWRGCAVKCASGNAHENGLNSTISRTFVGFIRNQGLGLIDRHRPTAGIMGIPELAEILPRRAGGNMMRGRWGGCSPETPRTPASHQKPRT